VLVEQAGAFAEVVFAISDWSPERRYLGPFRDLLAGGSEWGDGTGASG